jgi:hypothetical protein
MTEWYKNKNAPILFGWAAIIYAAGWCLAMVLPPLFQGIGSLIGSLIEAVGSAIGLGTAIVAAGLASVLAASPSVVTVAGIGVTLATCTVTVIAVGHVTKEVKRHPHEYILGTLVFGALIFMDLGKELIPHQTEFEKWSLKAVLSALLLIGGMFWKARGLNGRVLAFVLFLIGPAILFLIHLARCASPTIACVLSQIQTFHMLFIGGMIAVIMISGIGSWIDQKPLGAAAE